MVKTMNNDDKKDVPFYVEDFTASFFEQEKQLREECDEEWVDLEFIELFNGKIISVWKEGNIYHFTTANVTLNFLEDEWKEFKKDLNKFNDL